jgi:uncharacterized protein DUF5302
MAGADPEPTRPDEDEAKRKFRETLERKRGQQAAKKGEGKGKDASRVHGAHGPAKSQRQFRRKSG